MDRRKIFNWLIALFVAAGLVVAPLSVPAMAAPHAAMVSEEMQPEDMQSMADAMPCCPGEQDQKARDCGSCPFVALCLLSMSMPAPSSAGVLMDRAFSYSAFALPDDLLADGLGEHPPDHPPRTNV